MGGAGDGLLAALLMMRNVCCKGVEQGVLRTDLAGKGVGDGFGGGYVGRKVGEIVLLRGEGSMLGGEGGGMRGWWVGKEGFGGHLEKAR